MKRISEHHSDYDALDLNNYPFLRQR